MWTGGVKVACKDMQKKKKNANLGWGEKPLFSVMAKQ